MRPLRMLDLYCGAGGAAAGYHQAGFVVTGVDLYPQQNYPFDFHQADALEFLTAHGHEFDVIHASPPCQAYSLTQRLNDRNHPDLIGATRELLKSNSKPWIIENVAGAPLLDPIMLCGSMFGLRTYRHRLFESSMPLTPPAHPEHLAPQAKMGRPVKGGEFLQIIGNFSGVGLAREILGTPWMTRREMSECVPPQFTRFLGEKILELIAIESVCTAQNQTLSSAQNLQNIRIDVACLGKRKTA